MGSEMCIRDRGSAPFHYEEVWTTRLRLLTECREGHHDIQPQTGVDDKTNKQNWLAVTLNVIVSLLAPNATLLTPVEIQATSSWPGRPPGSPASTSEYAATSSALSTASGWPSHVPELYSTSATYNSGHSADYAQVRGLEMRQDERSADNIIVSQLNEHSAVSAVTSKLRQQEDKVVESLSLAGVAVGLEKAKWRKTVDATHSDRVVDVRVRHISVRTEALANLLQKELSQRSNLGVLATMISTCPFTKGKGGENGWAGMSDEHLDEFFPRSLREAAITLKPGDIIQASPEFGLHVVQVVDVFQTLKVESSPGCRDLPEAGGRPQLLVELLQSSREDDLLLHKSNPLKFWERRDVVEINEQRIRQGTPSVANINAFPSFVGYGFVPASGLSLSSSELAHNVVKRLDQHRPWATKDPRLSLPASEWLALLDKNAICILTVRHPLAFANSMMAYSNSIGIREWVSIWLVYMTRALDSCPAQPLVLVQHDELVKRPKQVHLPRVFTR